MKDFKKMPKMACGGGVQKYSGEDGSYVKTDDIVSKIREYSRSGHDIDPGIARPLPKDYVDRDPGMGRIPKGEITIPGVGKYKTQPPKTKGDLVFLKKGGKTKRGNKK